MSHFNVSIIIPAYNAAKTLSETLDSLRKQTRADWEAIVVDDGSSDDTVVVANQFASQDSRIRVITQANQGVSAARNTGVRLAQTDWLLFLDSDDWVAENYLARMIPQIEEDPSLDVIYCEWTRVTPDGLLVPGKPVPQSRNLFNFLARYCVFAIHACVIRRAVFDQVGGFDPSLKTCEDWDLWQRIARQGCRFVGIPDVLAYYRMRSQSLSLDSNQLLIDGLRVLDQSHSPDPRILNPHPDHKNGYPVKDLNIQKFYWTTTIAGLVIGASKDATPLLEFLSGNAPDLDPRYVADALFNSVVLPTCSPLSAHWQLWPKVSQPLQDFLVVLEKTAEAKGLAHRVTVILERMVLEHTPEAAFPVQIGHTYGMGLDVTQPLVDIVPPEGAERLQGQITWRGHLLGVLQLPVCDGQVSQIVLQDSIAGQFFWSILGCFFEETVYRQWPLPEGSGQAERAAFHNQVGWTIFLQDLWDRPNWAEANFYDASQVDSPSAQIQPESGALMIEVSDPLPEVMVAGSVLKVTLTVGGVALGIFPIAVQDGKVSTQALRLALIVQGGVELCRAVVREALVGQSHAEATTLRSRLAIAAQHRVQTMGTSSSPISMALAEGFEDLPHTLILGQRYQTIGSSSFRWASLPAQAAEDLLVMAKMTGDAIAQSPAFPQPIKRIIYAPDALVPRDQNQSTSRLSNVSTPTPIQTDENNRNFFESLFASQPDPWKYTTDYEQIKYEQTLSLLPNQKLKRALELACAEGHFTMQLAPHVESLLAADISQIALERTAQRCAQFTHVQYKQLDLATDPLPESLHLIVCSEVLYYLGDWETLHNFVRKVVNALELGGYFLTAHAHLVVDEPDLPGYDWDHPFGAKGMSDAFTSAKELRLVKELHTPLYRIQLFQKSRRTWTPWQKKTPSITVLPQPTSPPEYVASQVLWQGGKPNRYKAQPVTTDRLPILMYHRVAPGGSDATSSWRLTPEAFAEQMNYLRDAGYYTIGLGTWQQAIATKTPLPGRAIVLTFDDGYLDFLTYAHPILQAYGFSATVFLVSDLVGQSNQWDAMYGEEVPLMDWTQIRQLQAQGIEFGSHSATHCPLTSLSVEDIVREGVRSRTILTQELGLPVQTIAYPYGDVDPVVQHLIGVCGYTIGLSCRSGKSSFQDSSLLLPRIEVEGTTSLQEFVNKLSKN